MSKNNMRTPEEKEKILKEFYLGNLGRNEICRKYNISTRTLADWRIKYEVSGIDGLKSNTGKSKGGNKGLGLKKGKINEEKLKFNNLVWNGWKYLTRPFEIIISDMTAFRVKGIYYELTLYFDAWNKEIVGYGLASRKGSVTSYYDGLNQVLERIKKRTNRGFDYVAYRSRLSLFITEL